MLERTLKEEMFKNTFKKDKNKLSQQETPNRRERKPWNAVVRIQDVIDQLQLYIDWMRAVQAKGYQELTKEELREQIRAVSMRKPTQANLTRDKNWLNNSR